MYQLGLIPIKWTEPEDEEVNYFIKMERERGGETKLITIDNLQKKEVECKDNKCFYWIDNVEGASGPLKSWF